MPMNAGSQDNASADDAAPIFACDAGNTTLEWSVWADGEWKPQFRMAAEEDEIERHLASALGKVSPPPSEAGRCVVASVRPSLAELLRRCWREAGGRVEMEFFGRDVGIPLKTDVRNRHRVGVDRLLCALGASRHAGSPCVVVSAGSAIVIDAVDESGVFVGGAIAPGFRLAARSLARDTECLPLVEPDPDAEPPADSTEDAMRAGLMWLCRGGAAELVRRIGSRLDDEEVPVVVTGGDARLLLPLPGIDRAEWLPDLLFRGISAALGL